MSDTSVLLLSMRRVANLVAYCAAYEFEDTIQQLTDADRIDIEDFASLEFSRRLYKAVRFATGSRTLAMKVAPTPKMTRLERDYDFFFPVFNHPHELYALAALPDWRKRCRRAACFIVELWPHLLPGYLLELLSAFDHVFVGSSHVVKGVAQLTGRPCTYLPIAADVVGMAPPREAPDRIVDVCYIGRRSQSTHEALLALESSRRDFFYFYDSVAASGLDLKQRTFRVQSASEHRHLLASILRRTRYYVANRARVNEPAFTRGGDEISIRFYEGAATGTVMIGDPPKSREFESQFDWPDAVIPMPFDAPDVAALIAELDNDPARLERARRENVYHSALRHDWLYRARTMFGARDLKPTMRMAEREKQLQRIALDTGVSIPYAATTEATAIPVTAAQKTVVSAQNQPLLGGAV